MCSISRITSSSHCILKLSLCIIHKLCKDKWVVMRFGTCFKGMSTHLSKIFHHPFNMPKALSIAICALDWMKFQSIFSSDNSFSHLWKDTKTNAKLGVLHPQLVYKAKTFPSPHTCQCQFLGIRPNHACFPPNQNHSPKICIQHHKSIVVSMSKILFYNDKIQDL